MARRFSPGEMTVWSGPAGAIDPLLELVYAGCAAAGGTVSLLEGANRFNPYAIGATGRALGVDATETLRRVRLARAFTVHQLVALAESWPAEIARTSPDLLVAHDLPALFEADEVPDDERRALFDHLARQLADTVERSRRALVVTLAGGLDRFPGLATVGPRLYEVVVVRRSPGGVTRLRAVRENVAYTLAPRASGQRGLDEFGGDAEEVMPWGEPPRRTVRRSKRG